jgi:DNA invertase Pin-like site-specific DNA recombinase
MPFDARTIRSASRSKKVQQMAGPELVPAAQYVRMSDESQDYSIENQKTLIQDYAARYGFVVVKTYADLGRSGVVAKHRLALSELLHDVTNGTADYKAILVYDVSRWGRFQDIDESAHYEFLCRSAGIPVHYCAEPFTNDGTATSTLLKALKRSMAAEFSRELSVKEFRCKSRLAQLGFWVGGNPAYGYRRLLVSADGTPKQILNWGEQKNIKTDRVILVPGPQDEIECVRSIFSMALEGESCRSIARHLNRCDITHFGRHWLHGAVYKVLKNPMYAGVNIWNRTSTRMRSKRKTIASQEWITKPGAFPAIIDRQTFERAQLILPLRPLLLSNRAILKKVRRLLKVNGRLGWTILQNAHCTPPLANFIKGRFGSYGALYKKVGYQLPSHLQFKKDQLVRSIRLRREIIEQIKNLFPDNVVVSHLPPSGKRSLLAIDSQFTVSVLLCGPCRRRGRFFWLVKPHPAESSHITLLCVTKRTHERTIAYFVFPRLDGFKSHYMARNDPFLQGSVRLRHLADFYTTVKRVWDEKQGHG